MLLSERANLPNGVVVPRPRLLPLELKFALDITDVGLLKNATWLVAPDPDSPPRPESVRHEPLMEKQPLAMLMPPVP